MAKSPVAGGATSVIKVGPIQLPSYITGSATTYELRTVELGEYKNKVDVTFAGTKEVAVSECTFVSNKLSNNFSTHPSTYILVF